MIIVTRVCLLLTLLLLRCEGRFFNSTNREQASGTSDLVLETQTVYRSNVTTFTFGLPYYYEAELKPTRLSLGERSLFTGSLLPVISTPKFEGGSAQPTAASRVSAHQQLSSAQQGETLSGSSKSASSSCDLKISRLSIDTKDVSATLTLRKPSLVWEIMSGTSTTLLTVTPSASTSTLYSTSAPLEPEKTAGTILTELPKITKQTLIKSLVPSSLVESIELESHTTAKTIYDRPLLTENFTSSVTYTLTVKSVSSVSASSTGLSTALTKSFVNRTTVLLPKTTEVVSTSISIVDTTFTTTSVSLVSSTRIVTASSAPEVTLGVPIQLFKPVNQSPPPNVFPKRENPLTLPEGVSNSGNPYQTNKFYTNLIVGSQSNSVNAFPYSVWKFQGEYHGFAVGHTSSSQYSFGRYANDGSAGILATPLGIAQIIFSAQSLDSSHFRMSVTDMEMASCTVRISDGSINNIEIPVVQGMAFTTAIYHGSMLAKLHTSIGFKLLTLEDPDMLAQGVSKYRATLLSGVEWLIYVTTDEKAPEKYRRLSVFGTNTIIASDPYDGLIIQVAVAPDDKDKEIFYDQSAGMYVRSFELGGVADGENALFSFDYKVSGKSESGYPMVFALPHHVAMMDSATLAASTGIKTDSTTAGLMTAFMTNSLKFVTEINSEVAWLPYTSDLGKTPLVYSESQLKLLASVANEELQVNIKDSIATLNTYYIGKILDKFAYILLTVSDIIQDDKVSKQTLDAMKDAFAMLVGNKQSFPLFYDTKFSGIISSADWSQYNGLVDFGATYYNDHHFHYGYLIHAAAVVAHVDAKFGGQWAKNNRHWVEALIRDVANPSSEDTYFPVFRSFDWFHGHSWASGLYESGNGKNEESSSEDYNFAYAMKMWGKVVGDSSMEYRGDVMLSVMKKAMNCYMLYSNDNNVMPQKIIKNKVSGILFENVIDYTTYFGTNKEYIHGIHMLPITPASSVIRGAKFVSEEWNEKLSSIVDGLNSGWEGILKLNQALFDPAASYKFFANEDFDSTKLLDNGMSRTWSLAFSGGLANSLRLL